jgi:hypothetical protein
MTAQLTQEVTQTTTTQPAVATSHGPLRRTFHRILAAIREMNYTSHRLVEVQAPWTVDAQWHNR